MDENNCRVDSTTMYSSSRTTAFTTNQMSALESSDMNTLLVLTTLLQAWVLFTSQKRDVICDCGKP
ncbi:hypothetical protein KIN20_002327 [Parelaphostrongylus tenuis]|uniref:Uncharacterized protein n=1 Tax=Parelaphostrongylus tenuis TaxID=148309 RepID=A0AAD5LXJ2_PARTN|nr:hypothetical protein KIN20_002327 [Parelaphostrongylus tenuis]